MHRRLAAGLTVVLLVTVVTGVILVDLSGETDHNEIESGAVLAQFDDVDRTVFEITVFDSGDARWAVESRTQIPFDDSEQRAQFDEFAEQFVSEETETFENFRLRAERLIESGTDATDREMAATEFQRDAFYDEATQQGVIEMSFRWEEFAQVSEETVTVSDVFGGGFAILEDQQLRIHRGDNLVFDSDSIDPAPDRLDRTDNVTGSEWVRWDGPQEFDSDRPHVRLVAADAVAPENGQQHAENGVGSADDQEDENEEDNSGMMTSLLVAMIVLVVVGGVAIWYASVRTEPETDIRSKPDHEPTQTTEPESDIGQDQLLSDEDRVLKLLEENGGRMRQVTIVEETEWSKSKVSMLLSDMEEEGDISKLRVGRENIISLAGEEPEAAGSPFENEGE